MYWMIQTLRALWFGVSTACTLLVFGYGVYWLYSNRPDLLLPIVAAIAIVGVIIGIGATIEEGVFSA